MIAGLLLMAWLPAARAEPSDATVVYYNARLALREDAPVEAVRFWMLRNAMKDHTGLVSAHDGDFHSVTWAALAELGICPDGLPADDDGAGLWTLALHNHIVRTRGRPARTPRVKAFDAFSVGRQQRHVAIRDVLSIEEMEALRLARGWCVRPWRAQVVAQEGLRPKLRDRHVAARTMRDLLERAQERLHREVVRGYAVVEARLFDLDLQLTAISAREARTRARNQSRMARALGLNRGSIEAMNAGALTTTLPHDSQAARVVRSCVHWPVAEWMALSADRRTFLFDHARKHARELGLDSEALDQRALEITDALLAQRDGAGVGAWIARIEGAELQHAVWSGERGRQLLALDASTGFTERGPIALHRGVALLEQGDLDEALRSMAFALQQAPASVEAETVARLSRRWLTFVAGRFAVSDTLVRTLRTLMPRRDFSILLEDLLWRAAFHADGVSFANGVEVAGGRSALDRRMALLEPLASGNVSAFSQSLEGSMDRSPSETLRFLEKFVSRLELESRSIRAAQLPTVAAIQRFLARLVDAPESRYSRTAQVLSERFRGIEDGLVDPALRTDERERAERLDPELEVFAGNVRLAPSDTLPWPFVPVTPPPPSVFVPLELTPIEWHDEAGALIFGWSITE